MLKFKRILKASALLMAGLSIAACSGGGGGGGGGGGAQNPGGPVTPGKIPTFTQIDASKCLSETIRDSRERDFPGFRGFDDESPQKRLGEYIDRGDASCVKAVLSRGAKVNDLAPIGVFDRTPMLPIFAALRKDTLWKDKKEVGVLRVLVEAGADVNVKNNQGQTPLQIALSANILKEYPNAAAYLISSKKCDLEQRDAQGLTPIWIAMYADAIETVFQLINYGANLSVHSPQGENLLQAAINQGTDAQNLAVTLVQKGVDPMAANRNGDNSLHMAARHKYLDVANAILAKTINVNAQNNQRETALLLAIRAGSNPIALNIISKGADVNLASDKTSPLHAALESNNVEVANALLPKVTNVNTLNSDKQTALLLATRHSSAALVKAILDRGGDAKLADQNGFTPLMIALDSEQTDKANELLAKSDVNQKSADGFTAAFFAKNVAQLQNLVNSGADLNWKANNGSTVLSKAIASNNSDIATFVIERGADVSWKDAEGNTLLHGAIARNKLTVARALLERRIEANVKNVKGETPMFNVRGAQAVNLLVEFRGNINQSTPDGRSVVSEMVSSHLSGHGGNSWAFEVLQRLVELRANVDVKTEKGVPVLIEAAITKDFSLTGVKTRDESKLLNLLLDGGAKVNVLDAKKNTALHAADTANEVGLLLNRGADRALKNSEQKTALQHHQSRKAGIELDLSIHQEELDKIKADLEKLQPGNARYGMLMRRKIEIEGQMKAQQQVVDELNKIIIQLQ